VLERHAGEHGWQRVGSGSTDQDGRLHDLVPEAATPEPGTYRLTFGVADYFSAGHVETFYPEIAVIFRVRDEAHYHVPLLLSPFGYSTYRGS
jgi:5-hydroxyisourate hydrolase